MTIKSSQVPINGSRRPSRLGAQLARHKSTEAAKHTLEQRILIALELSDSAAALQQSCFNNP